MSRGSASVGEANGGRRKWDEPPALETANMICYHDNKIFPPKKLYLGGGRVR